MLFSRNMSTDYNGLCGNCRFALSEDDAYCRRCGTKAGEGEFKPYNMQMQCIYGPPPVKRSHKCGSCGFAWETFEMIDYNNYCPKCGAKL